MKIALIGQSAFGADVLKALIDKGHQIVIVYTIPDKNEREDVLALEAKKHNIPVLKRGKWRQKGEDGKLRLIPEVLEEYRTFGAELNVLPFCSQFIPLEITEEPKYKSIVYHPSILPTHRGASAINWTLIHGDEMAGLTVFWPDDGLDTGPILLQKSVKVEEDDTLNTLYKRFLYPEGVKAMVEAVELIAEGRAPRIIQPKEGASYEPHITMKPELAELQWTLTQREMHNFIRGNDSVPGAWVILNGERVILYSSTMYKCDNLPKDAMEIKVSECPVGNILVHSRGLLLPTSDGKFVNVGTVKLPNGKTIPGGKYGTDEQPLEQLILSDEEKKIENDLREIWKGILRMDISDEIDFFESGATSQDVTRLIEEIRFKTSVELDNTQIYMAPKFSQHVITVVKRYRGEDAIKLNFDAVKLSINNMDISFPHQMFINGEFIDSESGRFYETINPSNEKAICSIPKGSSKDVDQAVEAAKIAFEDGEWTKISARERGRLLAKLADLMEEHKEELATIESIDSGAVYTLALKTHVGMSIDVWRYFAGWTDKIEGKTIPISNARPNQNLCMTVREPVGVCAIITPWNYPLMMLSWKMAACLAAGNTVIHKPAQVTPLTALKFAELSVRAGIPKGVINVVTGSGAEIGQALCDNAHVRKIGFTGSTEVGAQVMSSCALSNIKRVSLELGGKSPLIIFADADIERAVKQACNAVFFNKGENCIAAGRIFVAASIHDLFIQKVIEETKKIVIGDPLDRSTSHGPQNHRAHLIKLLEYVRHGTNCGARLVLGGHQVNRPGLFFEPTILIDVDDDNYVAKEESFGPVMVVSKFDDEDIDGVIKRANTTEFGLASGVFSKDVSKVLRVARGLKAGTVFINTYQKTDVASPFGGFKQSGFGKDLGAEALNDYLQTKTITFEY